MAESTKQRSERGYYSSILAIHAVAITLFAKFGSTFEKRDRNFAQLLLYQYRLFHCWLISVSQEKVYRG